MRGIALALAAALATAVAVAVVVRGSSPGTANASSHREAPLISQDPSADNTDLYAFRSPDKPDTVTIVSNWIPGEDPAAQRRGRERRLDAVRQRRRGLGERPELVAAAFAGREVLLVRVTLALVQRVEGVRRRQLVDGLVRHGSLSGAGSRRSSCSRARPLNIRLLIVPRGCPSLSASSDWLKPP